MEKLRSLTSKLRFIKLKNTDLSYPEEKREQRAELVLEPQLPELEVVQGQVAKLAKILEQMRLADYITYLNRPGRLLLINFATGLARGLGAAIGATLLAGLAIMVLKWLGVLNLPLIGGVIADLVEIVNEHVGSK
ncbi:MAG: DUF5665 domain-containing protein [Desulfitobacteriaceae bacterium]